jgi:hypothetical protein
VAAKPTRRAVLVAAAALPFAAVGCDGVKVVGAPPPLAPDVTTLREAIVAEQLMVDRYTAVLRNADVTLARTLRPLLDEHRAHLAQLRSRMIIPVGSHYQLPVSSARPSPAAAASADIAMLRSAEQAAAAAMLDRLRRAPASLAQLFASISASEATHVPALDAAAGQAAP